MPRSKHDDESMQLDAQPELLDDQPLDDEAEAEAPAEAETAPEPQPEHRGHIPGISNPDAGVILVGRVLVI